MGVISVWMCLRLIFAKAAELYGAAGYSFDKIGEVGDAITAALACG